MSIDNTTDMTAVKAEQKRLEASGRLHWVHWAVVLASLFLTIGAWYYTKTQSETQIRNQFEREASRTIELISERMQAYEDTLWSGVATIASKDYSIDRETWKKYSQSLHIEATYPGILGIGVISHVEPSLLEAFLKQQREDMPSFDVFPEHTQNDYFPIIYIEPIESNRAAVGLDMAHETNRYEAAKKARDTGIAQITGPITLVQDSQKTPGFLFYAPFYSQGIPETVEQKRETFEGMVYAPFIFHKLMEGTLNAETRHVGVSVSDDDVMLFDENKPDVKDYDPNPMFTQKIQVEMYGRQWNFDIRSAKSFRTANANNKPWLILAGGFFIDAMLLTLFSLLARSNRRALSFAGRMVEAQQIDAKRLKNVIETAVDGLMTISASGKVESVNPACEGIFGYHADDIIGQDISVIYDRRQSHEIANDYDPAILLGKDRDIVGIRQDGTRMDLAVSVSEIEVRGELYYNAIIRDVTKRKAEEEDRVELIKELKYSNEELEKFAYVASHDLKSPLRAIDNLSAWLEEDLSDKLDEENRERIKLMRGRVMRMEGLLNSLLDYSRAGNTSTDTALVSVNTLVEAVRGFLDIPTGFKVIADESLEDLNLPRMPLEMVLNNLVNNAIKHHDKDIGTVRISAQVLNKFYEFRVEDDGPGIAPEFHDKIFEMFQTLRPRDEVEGSGMGLAVVKKTITQHGGEITVETGNGRGSVFAFTLPKKVKRSMLIRKIT